MALAFWLPRDLTAKIPDGDLNNGWCVGAWLRWDPRYSIFRLVIPADKAGEPETAFTVLSSNGLQVTREHASSKETKQVGKPVREEEWIHVAIGLEIGQTTEILLNGVVVEHLPGAPGTKRPSTITFASRQAIADPIAVEGYRRNRNLAQWNIFAVVPSSRLLLTLPEGAVSVRHPLPGVAITGNTMGLADLIDTVSGNVAEIYEQRKDLGTVTLDLKVVPVDTSGAVTLPVLLDDKGQALDKPLDSQALTTVHLEFTPPPPPPSRPAAQLQVPNLGGLTEVLARRLAEAAGFSLELFSQFEARPEHSGRVVRQHPAADALAPRGTKLLAFLGQSG